MFRALLPLTILLTLGLTACSGHGGDNSPSVSPPPPTLPPAPDSIQRDYLGPMFSAPWQIGNADCLRYFTACIESESADGVPGAERQVRQAGEVLRIVTTRPGYVAVDVQHAVIGPIEAVDPGEGFLKVLGQDVYVLDNTFTDRPRGLLTDLATFGVGDSVAVSGSFTAEGEIYASKLSRTTPGALLVRGVLAAGVGGKLRIGALEVDLGAASLEGFPGSAPLPGDTVLLKAEGTWSGGPLAVRSARLTSGVWTVGSAQTEAKTLIGFVTASRSPSDFDVAGYRVDLSACGCPPLAATPAIGTLVTIDRAPFNTPGAAALNPITFRSIVMSGPIEDIDASQGTITVLGTRSQLLPATYIVSAEVAGYELPSPEENLVMPLWPRGSVADLKRGDVVTIIGGARGAQLVAGAVIRVGQAYGGSIATSLRIIAGTGLQFLGQPIEIDSQTRVSDCTAGPCRDLSLDAFFSSVRGQYFPPILGIALESATPPLRARTIRVIAWQD